jgi:hypothetical protein
VLLMPNKKKIASVIVAGMKPKEDFVQKMGEENGTGSYKLPEKEDDGDSMGLESAMEAFLSAADKKDPKGMAKAFKNAMVLCEEGAEEPASEGE